MGHPVLLTLCAATENNLFSSHSSMFVRGALAAIDHNANIDRVQV